MNCPIFEFFPGVVMLYIRMLGLCMHDGVLDQMYAAHIVAQNWGWRIIVNL
jgi:hypothetical protein